VLGVHPEEGHDIPGVRSLAQLSQTALFHPEEYEATTMVTNADAYAMCQRLVIEESIIAGPSSGMAVCGALAMLPDEPGCLAVIIFADNIFKYPSSLIRHFPELFRHTHGVAQAAPPAPRQSPYDGLLDGMIERCRGGASTIELGEAERLIDAGAVVVDVRTAEQYRAAHLPGALHLPLASLDARLDQLPPDHQAPIITVCNRGNMSLPGMLILRAAGYDNAVSLNGGTHAWHAAGLAVDAGD
jgi:rhodanese-related sulfurtransferase